MGKKQFTWKTTQKHPVRYVAQEEFPAIVELDESIHHTKAAEFWTEAGYYWNAMKNTCYEGITDGVYGHIYLIHDQLRGKAKGKAKSREVVGYSVEVSVSLPNALRVQRHWEARVVVQFTDAKDILENFLRKAYQWIERMLKETEGLTRTIQWKKVGEEFVLSQIGMRTFTSKIFPNSPEIQEFVQIRAHSIVCPVESFGELKAALKKFQAYPEIVG